MLAAMTIHSGEETELPARPWRPLESAEAVELWIAQLNTELQAAGASELDRGQGVRLTLAHGGDITLHTNSHGDVLLDVEPEAGWVTPLLAAASGLPVPRGSVWRMPGDRLLQLVLGLDSLIAAERLVLKHRFRV